MLSRKTLELEAVLPLIGTIVAAFFFGNVVAGLLLQSHVNGFKTEYSTGFILLATLSFHGVVIVLGTAFLIARKAGWGEVMGTTGWLRSLGLACAALICVAPLILGLEWISVTAMQSLHLPVESQEAVKMILSAPPQIRAYLAVFTVVLAPVAEEFFFRGLLFSLAKQFNWPKLGWIGVSFLFALMHVNGPTFLSLFMLALALTWLCEKTGGLLAPIVAHSLFNAINLAFLLLAGRNGDS